MTTKKTLLTILALIIAVGAAIWIIHATGHGCDASCYAPAATSAEAR